ncbi:cell division cycle protein 27 homolog [Diadema antillarum]|uniref:cell division cycle protein 27 homolog n=1 Tax=Diadema antillarum TaxID=105358 RepID=UPI003A89061D
MVIQEPVQAAIWQSLNHYAYQDAIFLAERLYAEVGSDEGLFLLATCYYRSGQPMSAYTLLRTKGCPTPQCRFLMARCCLDMEKLADCETALTGSSILKPHSCEDIVSDFKESAPFALSVLGKVCSNTERLSRSAEAHKLALKHNPFLWSSFEALCDLGEKVEPEKIFHLASTPTNTSVSQQESYPILDTENMGTGHLNTAPDVTPIQAETPQDQLITQLSGIRPLPLTTPDFGGDLGSTPDSGMSPFTVPAAPLSSRQSQAQSRVSRLHLNSTSSPYSPLSPSFGILPLDTPSPTQGSTPSFAGENTLSDPKAPMRRGVARRGPQSTKPPVFSQSGNSSNTKDPALMSIQQSPVPSGAPVQLLFPSAHGVRRSSRLYSNANSVKENTSATTKTTSNRTKTGVSKVQKGKARARTTRSSTITKPPDSDDITKMDNQKSNELNKANSAAANLQLQQIADLQKSSAEGLLRLLRDIGKAYLALSRYDLKKAIDLFKALPPQHYNTAWVLCQVGKAFFELAQYHKAETIFSEVRRLEPHHLGSMEIYSTALWHLQKETALSALAQELTDFNPESSQAWCTAGNCFSLQKEHETAIKFFQRAIQVNPKFAYAYTLLGHEYVATEELDRAMACFRNAIRISPRHYNAWYGTGMIYYKQEKFALAEMHYSKALAINPQSSVLLVHISVVQHAMHKSEQALATLAKAIRLDASNPLCRFHRASILFATEKYQDALKELEELKQMTPSESLVYFLIGKVYKKLGQTHQALANFSWALDLDPKGANSQIKEALDKHYLPEDDEPAVTALAQVDSTSQGPADDSDMPGDVSRDSLLEGEDMQLQANESDESL